MGFDGAGNTGRYRTADGDQARVVDGHWTDEAAFRAAVEARIAALEAERLRAIQQHQQLGAAIQSLTGGINELRLMLDGFDAPTDGAAGEPGEAPVVNGIN